MGGRQGPRSRGPRDRAGHLESAILEGKGEGARIVLRGPHLRHAQPPLHVEVRRRMHLELHDAVREIRLRGRMGGRAEVHRLLGYQEGQGTKVAQPLEEEIQVGPGILHLRHRLEDVKGVDDEDRDPVRFHHVVAVHLEQLEPRAAALEVVQVLADAPHVEDLQVLPRLRVRHPEGRHVLERDVLRLLQREVRGLPALLQRVLVENRERERGLHRARRAAHEDDVSLWDAAREDVVEAPHVRLDAFPLRRIPPGPDECADRRKPFSPNINALCPRRGELDREYDALYRLTLGIVLTIAVTVFWSFFLNSFGVSPSTGLGDVNAPNIAGGLIGLSALFFALGWWRGAYPWMARVHPALARVPKPGPGELLTEEERDHRIRLKLRDLAERRESLRRAIKDAERRMRLQSADAREHYEERRERSRAELKEVEAELKQLEEERAAELY